MPRSAVIISFVLFIAALCALCYRFPYVLQSEHNRLRLGYLCLLVMAIALGAASRKRRYPLPRMLRDAASGWACCSRWCWHTASARILWTAG